MSAISWYLESKYIENEYDLRKPDIFSKPEVLLCDSQIGGMSMFRGNYNLVNQVNQWGPIVVLVPVKTEKGEILGIVVKPGSLSKELFTR